MKGVLKKRKMAIGALLIMLIGIGAMVAHVDEPTLSPVERMYGSWEIIKMVDQAKMQQTGFVPGKWIGKEICISPQAVHYPDFTVDVEGYRFETVNRINYEIAGRMEHGLNLTQEEMIILQTYNKDLQGHMYTTHSDIIVLDSDQIICPMYSGWFLCERKRK